MTKKILAVYGFCCFFSIAQNPAIASDCPFADTFAMIRVSEQLSGPLSKKNKLARIDESIDLIQQELKQKTVLDHPMTKIEAAACKDDLKKLKSKRTELSQSVKASTSNNSACTHLYVGKAVTWNADGCVFDCKRTGQITGIGSGVASVHVSRSGNMIEGACVSFQ